MRAVLQRVLAARVAVDGETVAEIGRGVVVLLGVAKEDTDADCDYIAQKVAGLRLFEGPGGKLDIAAENVRGGAAALVVPNFTLCADTRRGRRPDLALAADPWRARELCTRFADRLKEIGLEVKEGVFGSHMHVDLTNDGPVTLILESTGR